MMDTSETEKNEVLLKFAGFTWDGFWIDPNGFTFGAPWPGPDETIKESDWKVITGPDLLHSLDAQAKWLWPKLPCKALRVFMHPDFPFEAALFYEDKPPIQRTADNPAEACAEAILSLIKGEVSGEDATLPSAEA